MANMGYPDNWEEIATSVKEEANWECFKCGRVGIKPGEKSLDLSKFPRRAFILQVHHWDRNPSNNRRENLVCLCSPCHLLYLMSCKDKTINNKYKEQQQQQVFSLYNPNNISHNNVLSV